ncbi:hypothetical protein [Bradyrhizobium sp. RP6]|uniref:hypothetical protein n=1 Tax=Bradyrhizobium sp. RP6 TaxID=2489596 RepID=UPI0032DF3692
MSLSPSTSSDRSSSTTIRLMSGDREKYAILFEPPLIRRSRFAGMALLRWIMKWIRERDALIAQTLAFVQSVTGGKDDVRQPDAPAAGSTVAVESVAVEAVAVEIESPQDPLPPRPAPFPAPGAGGDFRTEMQARIADFRKHQERFERERKEYCAATLTRLRAAIRDVSGPPDQK